MTMLRILRRNEDGAAAIEMAIALPVLIAMIYGLFQVGLLYQANAGMQHALGEGARYATLCITSGSTCTAPTNDQIKTRAMARSPSTTRSRGLAIAISRSVTARR